MLPSTAAPRRVLRRRSLPSQSFNYNACASILISIGVWLLVITIVYFLLCGRAEDTIGDIKKIRDNITMWLEDVIIPCCTNIEVNCTCDNVINGTVSCWNAATNNPVLQSGIGNETQLYVTCEPGNTTLDGYTDWGYGDYGRFTNGVWWQNEAQLGISPFEHESYTLVLNATSSSGVVPAVAFTNWTVDLFILEDWVILHMPFAKFVSSISEANCSAATPLCFYTSDYYVSSSALPANRRPFQTTPFELYMKAYDYCLESSPSPDHCQQCGGANSNIFFSTGAESRYGVVEYRSDGTFHFFSRLFVSSVFTTCYDVYQGSFLYQVNL